MPTDIDRAQVVLYAIRCVVAGAVTAGVLAVALYLGRDFDTATKYALAIGGGVLAMLSHGTAYWAQSPKKQLPPVVNITSIAPPEMPAASALELSSNAPKKIVIPT